MKYEIARYEEKSDSLFVRLESTVNPVYIEHFFSDDERKDEDSRTKTIERFAAELELISDAYVKPEDVVSKVYEANSLRVNQENIEAEKAKRIEASINEANVIVDVIVDGIVDGIAE